jgi:hypothetical protein
MRRKPTFSPPAAAKAEVTSAPWETSRRGWPMFCNGCLLQNENVSRLNVLVSCPAAKQRNRLKALLLLSVPLPRNPRAAPAKNFQKRVSRFAIANPKNQPDFQIPWHRLLLLKVLEEYGNNSFSVKFNREANNSFVSTAIAGFGVQSASRYTTKPSNPSRRRRPEAAVAKRGFDPRTFGL